MEVTGNPQIITADVGTRLYLRCVSSNRVKWSDGNGLNLNGSFDMDEGDVLELIMTEAGWDEVSRNA